MGLADLVWPIFFPVLAVVVACLHIRIKKYTGTAALENFLMWQLALGLGLSLVWSAIGHLFLADQVAQSIGWPTGSPFQSEVGMWDGAMGIAGLLCLKFKKDFWTAVVIGPGLFLFGAGVGHLWELVVNQDTAPNNAGGVMYLDLLYPIFLATLLIWYRRNGTTKGQGYEMCKEHERETSR
jgi:hypothetical protein